MFSLRLSFLEPIIWQGESDLYTELPFEDHLRGATLTCPDPSRDCILPSLTLHSPATSWIRVLQALPSGLPASISSVVIYTLQAFCSYHTVVLKYLAFVDQNKEYPKKILIHHYIKIYVKFRKVIMIPAVFPISKP